MTLRRAMSRKWYKLRIWIRYPHGRPKGLWRIIESLSALARAEHAERRKMIAAGFVFPEPRPCAHCRGIHGGHPATPDSPIGSGA